MTLKGYTSTVRHPSRDMFFIHAELEGRLDGEVRSFVGTMTRVVTGPEEFANPGFGSRELERFKLMLTRDAEQLGHTVAGWEERN